MSQLPFDIGPRMKPSWANIDGPYRYLLGRRWGLGSRVLWVMLNPSTADASEDDPTIRRCVGFSKAWGFASLEVVNLFALRSTKPSGLLDHEDPFGPVNLEHIYLASLQAEQVVCAWGQHSARVRQLVNTYRPEVLDMLYANERELVCLGRTKRGDPRHPLYLAAKTERESF